MSDHAKELYRQLRVLPWEKLWNEEVARFNRSSPGERTERVAVIRAVAVVLAEAGAVRDKEAVQTWLLGLLRDPSEKIRRYAVAALPKIGAGTREESALLGLLDKAKTPGEKKFVLEALEKIGGTATLEALGNHGLQPGIEQKLKAGAARRLRPSSIRMDRDLDCDGGVRLHLRGRHGLERFVRAEVEECTITQGKFRVERTASGLVVLAALAPFSLADIYSWRCFGTVGFALGSVPASNEAESVEALARLITSPCSRRALETFTEGTIRYRLNFIGRGHQRAAIRSLAARVYELCPEILNDARDVTWTMDVCQEGAESSVELRPNMTPDPRFYYRRRDVPAASHPPLAACMARLAGVSSNDMVWDPFCGSGVELVECGLLGGAQRIVGTDRSSEAIDIARTNFAAANLSRIQTDFICGDFRDLSVRGPLGPGSATVIVTNPPMGIRVPINDRRGLINDLFSVAARVLRPGGRLVLVNPVRVESPPASLKLQMRQEVEMGGFGCWLEKYVLGSR